MSVIRATVLLLSLVPLQTACAIFSSEAEWKPTEAMTEELCFATTPQDRSSMAEVDDAVDAHAFGLSGRPAAVAKALHLLPLLDRRRQLLERDEGPTAGPIAVLQIERRIASRLTLASLDVTALSARVGCEGGRARELAESLERNKDRREDRRTVASILAGAATNVLTGIFSILDMAVTGGALGIAGGLTQYGFRGAGEKVNISIDFRHTRNFLHDLWKAPDEPELFPSPVWDFLIFHREDQPSLRERMLAQWKLGRNITDDESDDFKERYGVLFDSGGIYNLAQLRARSAMLELLRSSIELMHTDLAELVARLELESDPIGPQAVPPRVLPR